MLLNSPIKREASQPSTVIDIIIYSYTDTRLSINAQVDGLNIMPKSNQR
jgi:hypothetical protein